MEVKLDDKNFKHEVLESNVPTLVDFWAGWCAPCRMIAPIVEQISKEYQGKLKVCKLNVDEARIVASKYKIMSIPTLLVFKKGKIAGKIIGAVSKAELEDAIKPHI